MSNFQRMTNLSWDVYSHFPHPNMGSRNCNSPLVLIIIMCLSFIFPQLTSKFSLKYSSYCPLILVILSGVSWTCKCQFTVINKQQTKNRILHIHQQNLNQNRQVFKLLAYYIHTTKTDMTKERKNEIPKTDNESPLKLKHTVLE